MGIMKKKKKAKDTPVAETFDDDSTIDSVRLHPQDPVPYMPSHMAAMGSGSMIGQPFAPSVAMPRYPASVVAGSTVGAYPAIDLGGPGVVSGASVSAASQPAFPSGFALPPH